MFCYLDWCITFWFNCSWLKEIDPSIEVGNDDIHLNQEHSPGVDTQEQFAEINFDEENQNQSSNNNHENDINTDVTNTINNTRNMDTNTKDNKDTNTNDITDTNTYDNTETTTIAYMDTNANDNDFAANDTNQR